MCVFHCCIYTPLPKGKKKSLELDSKSLGYFCSLFWESTGGSVYNPAIFLTRKSFKDCLISIFFNDKKSKTLRGEMTSLSINTVPAASSALIQVCSLCGKK